MIKKIYILVIISVIIFSCGKKSDPIYKEKNQNAEKTSIQINTFS